MNGGYPIYFRVPLHPADLHGWSRQPPPRAPDGHDVRDLVEEKPKKRRRHGQQCGSDGRSLGPVGTLDLGYVSSSEPMTREAEDELLFGDDDESEDEDARMAYLERGKQAMHLAEMSGYQFRPAIIAYDSWDELVETPDVPANEAEPRPFAELGATPNFIFYQKARPQSSTNWVVVSSSLKRLAAQGKLKHADVEAYKAAFIAFQNSPLEVKTAELRAYLEKHFRGAPLDFVTIEGLRSIIVVNTKYLLNFIDRLELPQEAGPKIEEIPAVTEELVREAFKSVQPRPLLLLEGSKGQQQASRAVFSEGRKSTVRFTELLMWEDVFEEKDAPASTPEALYEFPTALDDNFIFLFRAYPWAKASRSLIFDSMARWQREDEFLNLDPPRIAQFLRDVQEAARAPNPALPIIRYLRKHFDIRGDNGSITPEMVSKIWRNTMEISERLQYYFVVQIERWEATDRPRTMQSTSNFASESSISGPDLYDQLVAAGVIKKASTPSNAQIRSSQSLPIRSQVRYMRAIVGYDTWEELIQPKERGAPRPDAELQPLSTLNAHLDQSTSFLFAFKANPSYPSTRNVVFVALTRLDVAGKITRSAISAWMDDLGTCLQVGSHAQIGPAIDAIMRDVYTRPSMETFKATIKNHYRTENVPREEINKVDWERLMNIFWYNTWAVFARLTDYYFMQSRDVRAPHLISKATRPFSDEIQ